LSSHLESEIRLGNGFQSKGRSETAASHYNNVLQLSQKEGDRYYEALALFKLALVERSWNILKDEDWNRRKTDYREKEYKLFSQSLTIQEEIGKPIYVNGGRRGEEKLDAAYFLGVIDNNRIKIEPTADPIVWDIWCLILSYVVVAIIILFRVMVDKPHGTAALVVLACISMLLTWAWSSANIKTRWWWIPFGPLTPIFVIAAAISVIPFLLMFMGGGSDNVHSTMDINTGKIHHHIKLK
jgi:hypothetical protein